MVSIRFAQIESMTLRPPECTTQCDMSRWRRPVPSSSRWIATGALAPTMKDTSSATQKPGASLQKRRLAYVPNAGAGRPSRLRRQKGRESRTDARQLLAKPLIHQAVRRCVE